MLISIPPKFSISSVIGFIKGKSAITIARNFSSEALGLLVDFGFNVLNLNNIMLEVFDFNIGAIRSYKKVGFKEIGKRRKAHYFAGEYHDEIFMDILAEEFGSPFVKPNFNKVKNIMK